MSLRFPKKLLDMAEDQDPHEHAVSDDVSRPDDVDILDRLSDSVRLDALAGCDASIIRYDPESFWMVFQVQGRNLRVIAWPFSLLALWGVGWALFLRFPLGFLSPEATARELERREAMLGALDSLEAVFAPLITALSFLLVFRLGRSAVRFWDARTAAGKLVELCRVLACDACVYCDDELLLRNNILRWLAVFPIAAKNYVRPSKRECERKRELEPLLSPAEASALLAASCPPTFVLTRIRMTIREFAISPPTHALYAAAGADASARAHAEASSALERSYRPFVCREMSECVNNLTATFGAMERINGTPLPFAYVSHLRSLLFINLGFTFLPMLSRDGLFALPGYLVLCWALLGIEAAAVECERPFQRKANHLAFGRFATVVASNIAQTVRVSALCSPRSPCTHVRKTDGIVRTAFEDVVVPPEEVLSPRSE